MGEAVSERLEGGFNAWRCWVRAREGGGGRDAIVGIQNGPCYDIGLEIFGFQNVE